MTPCHLVCQPVPVQYETQSVVNRRRTNKIHFAIWNTQKKLFKRHISVPCHSITHPTKLRTQRQNQWHKMLLSISFFCTKRISKEWTNRKPLRCTGIQQQINGKQKKTILYTVTRCYDRNDGNDRKKKAKRQFTLPHEYCVSFEKYVCHFPSSGGLPSHTRRHHQCH